MNKTRQREIRFASILTVHAPDADSLIDMMRYDRCHPLDQSNAEKIIRIGRWPRGDAQASDRIVQLLRTSASDVDPSPRWRSFSCSILDERAPDMPQLTESEIAGFATRPRGEVRPAARKRRKQPFFLSLVSVNAASVEAVIRVMQLEHCCPARETESAKLEALAGERGRPSDHLIKLARFAASNAPLDDLSCDKLGCDILDEHSTLTAGPSDAELAHLAKLPRELRGREVRR